MPTEAEAGVQDQLEGTGDGRVDDTFEVTDGVCPYCDNSHRDGKPYKVAWQYDKHIESCKGKEPMIEETPIQPTKKSEPKPTKEASGFKYVVEYWDITKHEDFIPIYMGFDKAVASKKYESYVNMSAKTQVRKNW